MKKPLGILAAALLVTSLAACSSPAATAPAEDEKGAPGYSALKNAKGETTITLWHGLGGINAEAFEALIDQFNAENTDNIKVESSSQGNYVDLLAKYTAGLRDDSTPTITLTNDVSSGFMNDVKRSVSPEAMAKANPDDLNLEDITAAGRNYYSVDGKMMSVPMNMSTPLVFVNKGLLEKAGVSVDSLDTLDGLAEAARAIKESTKVPGIAMAFDGWWFEQLSATSGAPYCAPDNGRTGKRTSEVSLTNKTQKNSFQTMADLYTDGTGLNVGTDNNNAVTAFAAGEVGMMFNSSATAGSVAKSTSFDYVAVPFPVSGNKKKSGTVVGGSSMWLSSSASDAEKVAGWKLISFLASATSQQQFSEATGYVPVNDKVLKSAGWETYIADHPVAEVAATQVQNVPFAPATQGCLTGAFTAIRGAVIPEMQSAFAGDISLEDALKNAAANANKSISDYKEQLGE